MFSGGQVLDKSKQFHRYIPKVLHRSGMQEVTDLSRVVNNGSGVE